MQTEKRAYRIYVSSPQGNALLFCVTYPLDSGKTLFGMEFFELMWSHERPPMETPSSRQASFKESIQILHQAYVSRDGATDEGQEIAKHVRSVYGEEASIQLSSVDHLLPRRAP